jgi:holo-[acyl-carrier protein] synthase
MLARTGCDVVYIPRFKKAVLRTPAIITRIFGDQDTTGIPLKTIAGWYAAKEAIIKTFDLHISHMPCIQITTSPTGRPSVQFLSSCAGNNNLKNIASLDVSISHERDYCIATAVALLHNS